jgi:hypothetical protein
MYAIPALTRLHALNPKVPDAVRVELVVGVVRAVVGVAVLKVFGMGSVDV